VAGQAVRRGWVPLTPMLAHGSTPLGAGGRRDRLSTMGKRRCDCAGGRAQAASVSASDGAPAQAVCRLPRFGILAVQHAPVACTHECNSNLSTLIRTETVRDSSRRTVSMDSLGGLPVNVEHVPHAVHTRTRSGTSTSCNKSRPLALKDQQTAGAVTRDTAQQMKEGAI
jgi:hypothetical protein